MYSVEPSLVFIPEERKVQSSLDLSIEDNETRKKPLPQLPSKNRHSALIVGPSWTTGSIRQENDNSFGSVKSYQIHQKLEQKSSNNGMLSPRQSQLHYSPTIYNTPKQATNQHENHIQPSHAIPPHLVHIDHGWKVSRNSSFKNVAIRRTDSLKIESSSIPSDNPQHLEKPDEPSTLQRKASKEEICLQLNEAPASLDAPRSSEGQAIGPENISSSNFSATSEPSSPLSSHPSIRKISATTQIIAQPPLNLDYSNESTLDSPTVSLRADVYSQLSNIPESITSYPSDIQYSSLGFKADSGISAPTVATQLPNEPVESKNPNPTESLYEPGKKTSYQNKFFESLKHSSLSIASYSLVQTQSNTKLYRRLAMKTRNRDIQMTFAKYLLQIAKLYDNKTNIYRLNSQSDDDVVVSDKSLHETPMQTRDRLLREAGFWIERLSKSRWPEALFIKGRWHLLGRHQAPECVLPGYDKPNESKAFKCFTYASKGGWAEAHYELANLWKKRGYFTKAVRSYEKGARENHTPSVYKMAKILLRGQLKEKKDVAKGLAYLKLAADAIGTDCAEPAFVLGCIYANEFECIGITSYQDKQALKDAKSKEIDHQNFALKCLKKSAQYGYSDAIYFMGQVFESGKLGQHCDIWQAYQHYSKAAELNHPGAMLDLSRLYCQGIPGLLSAQNDIGFKWCKRSADLGFDQAEFVLGMYFENGIGVEPDFPRALEYFGRAASKGFQPAAEKLNQPLKYKAQQQPNERLNANASSYSLTRDITTNRRSANNCVIQ